MTVELRPGRQEDAEICGRICYEAFAAIATSYNFPPDFPSPDAAVGFMTWSLSHPLFYSVVAEIDGAVIGSNFIDARNSIAGVGPITVDPSVQNKSVGRRLMQDVHDYVSRKNFPGVRLLQAAYHNRSLSLYAKLGYEIREPVSCMQGPPLKRAIPGCTVRVANEADLEACNALCRKIHGFDRGGELRDAVTQGTARIVERDGRITAYATTIGFFGHAIAKDNTDMIALIAATEEFAGPGFLLPSRNGELFRWCLENDLRVVQPLTLMSRGLYNEPLGAYLPSILY